MRSFAMNRGEMVFRRLVLSRFYFWLDIFSSTEHHLPNTFLARHQHIVILQNVEGILHRSEPIARCRGKLLFTALVQGTQLVRYDRIEYSNEEGY